MTQPTEDEHARWEHLFAGAEFYYGLEPGPIARRTIRYARPMHADRSACAIDVGCGEGQDLLLLRQSGYAATGLDFTANGLDKARRLLRDHALDADFVRANVLDWEPPTRFDLVLAVNCLQFLGADAPRALERVQALVAPGGVIGVSMFAREHDAEPALDGSLYRWTLPELLRAFASWQPFEAAHLYQWGTTGPQPFVTLIAARG